MIIIIRNTEINRLKSAKGWLLVYGRRKTGKSFLIENFTKWDSYFFVKRGGDIFEKRRGRTFDYNSFIALLEELMRENKAVVIDEFHRLPDDFLDFLHIHSNQGKITLISSTIWLTKRLIEKDSPILGLFHEVPIGLIDERDILKALAKYGNPKDIIALGTFLREPLMLRYLKKSDIKDIIADYFAGMKFFVPMIIATVFQEEDKEFTQIYEGVVRAIASGEVNSKNITRFLFSRKIIPKEEHGYSQQYLANLVKIGLVEKIKIFNSKKYIYGNTSPMIDAYYYLDEKYNFSEEDVTKKQINEFLDKIYPRYIESFIGKLLSKCYGLRRSKIVSSSMEVDIALSKFKKLEIVGEVKWKSALTSNEIYKIEDKLSKFKCKKFLIVPDKDVLERKTDIEVLTASDLIKLI